MKLSIYLPFLQLFIFILLLIPSFALAADVQILDWQCPRCPICSTRGTPLTTKLRYCLLSSIPISTITRELPFASSNAARRQAMLDVEELLLTHIVGQTHVTRAIIDVVRRKLSSPREPLVLHLAGDNGVGKTHTARLLSLATSLRCAPQRPQCDTGDNMLVISGTGFDGMPLSEAKNWIIERITNHQRVYPHGIILLDDLTAMHPQLVAALAPLFGRAERFAEQSSDAPSLAQLFIIVTTDFGQQGRTWGRSIAEIEQMVRDDFAGLYGTLVPAYTRTMVFMALTKKAAAQMVRNAVAALPCSRQFGGGNSQSQSNSKSIVSRFGIGSAGGKIVGSSIEEIAVEFLVARHRETWEGKENGHALRRAVEDTLFPLLLRYFDTHGHDQRVWARFRLNMTTAQIILDTSGIGVGVNNNNNNEEGLELDETGVSSSSSSSSTNGDVGGNKNSEALRVANGDL